MGNSNNLFEQAGVLLIFRQDSRADLARFLGRIGW